jgi:hypothetical protein
LQNENNTQGCRCGTYFVKSFSFCRRLCLIKQLLLKPDAAALYYSSDDFTQHQQKEKDKKLLPCHVKHSSYQ